MPSKVFSRNAVAVAVAESAGSVTVLVKGTTPVSLTVAQFDAMRAVPVPGPVLVSAAGRLWAVNHAATTAHLHGRWAAASLATAAMQHATASLACRRAAALDAIALGYRDALPLLQLSLTELLWYQARQAAVLGDLAALLATLEALPANGYRARVLLLAMNAPRLLGNRALAQRARTVLQPFAPASADAASLCLALAPAPTTGVVDVITPYAEHIAQRGGPSFAALAAIATAVAGRARPPVLPPTPSPQLRAWDAYWAGLGGASLDAALAGLGPLPVALLDDLIRAGALTRVPAGAAPWPADVAAYVRCRTDPGGADLTELASAGFVAELARRFFLAGDDTQLAALPDDPAVRHYRALRGYTVTAKIEQAEWLRPQARSVLELLDSVRQDGSRGVPEPVAADPSCWPLLKDLALRGGVVPDERLRHQHPRFAEWLDLCAMQAMLFDGQWDEVTFAGQRLAASSPLESFRDEAQNMAAFAAWQAGRVDEALRVLDEALAGEFTTGLAVNAALVASERGCLAALGYLERVMQQTADPRVRQGALGRAVAVWLEDADVPGYPPPLAAMVRSGLAAAQADDDFHQSLLLLSTQFDPEWLADAPTHTANPVQAAAARYYTVRARSLSARHRESLNDVATALVSVGALTPRLAWVEREQSWFTDLLMDGVHTDFGEAAFLAPAIETLVSGGALDLVPRIVLTAQVGGHLAALVSKTDGSLTPDAEQRLLFAPVRLYWARRSELDALMQELVSEELGRCLIIATLTMATATERQVNAFGVQWDRLVQRERWDTANRMQIISMERALLNEMDVYLNRCRAYLSSMQSLQLNDEARQLRDQIADSVRRWGSESARLRGLL